MKYVVLEIFKDINLVKDEVGQVMVFDSPAEATIYCGECQEGIIVPLINIFPILKDSLNLISYKEDEINSGNELGIEEEISEIIKDWNE